MQKKTSIEWTDVTWNPVVGCRHVAEGCRHCYAETMSKRLAAMGQADYASILTPEGKFNGKAITRPGTLAEPLKWKKPRMVFVNSMSDLFHEDVPFEFIAAVFGVMAACPQHTFQVLTKRPERARQFFEWIKTAQLSEAYSKAPFAGPRELAVCAMQLCAEGETEEDRNAFGNIYEMAGAVARLNREAWPLKNVWLGVSVAQQRDADRLVPILLKCEAAVRFVSAEPLIEAVDLASAKGLRLYREAATVTEMWYDGDHRPPVEIKRPGRGFVKHDGWGSPELDWVIVGGESGPGAREFCWEWAQSLRDQCKAAGVPMFFKQTGARLYDATPDAPGVISSNYKRLRDKKGGDPSGVARANAARVPNKGG